MAVLTRYRSSNTSQHRARSTIMQDFIATYGLWLLIALAIVAVLAFLFKGKDETKASDAPSAPTITTKSVEPAPPPAVPVAEPAPPLAIELPKAAAPAGKPDNLL